jgi:hypothetical protein
MMGLTNVKKKSTFQRKIGAGVSVSCGRRERERERETEKRQSGGGSKREGQHCKHPRSDPNELLEQLLIRQKKEGRGGA